MCFVPCFSLAVRSLCCPKKCWTSLCPFWSAMSTTAVSQIRRCATCWCSSLITFWWEEESWSCFFLNLKVQSCSRFAVAAARNDVARRRLLPLLMSNANRNWVAVSSIFLRFWKGRGFGKLKSEVEQLALPEASQQAVSNLFFFELEESTSSANSIKVSLGTKKVFILLMNYSAQFCFGESNFSAFARRTLQVRYRTGFFVFESGKTEENSTDCFSIFPFSCSTLWIGAFLSLALECRILKAPRSVKRTLCKFKRRLLSCLSSLRIWCDCSKFFVLPPQICF